MVGVIAVLLTAAFAEAASTAKPPTGPWKLQPSAGFTLKRGKGKNRDKIYLSDLHGKTGLFAGCPGKSTVVRVLGRFPLKRFTRAGYTAWGVGRNSGGDVTPRPGRVSAGGRTYNGSFHVAWNYSNPRQVIGGSIEFGSCLTQFTFGSPK